MVLLCFLLDLRTISPPLLRQLKQGLLQLANLYISSPVRSGRKSKKEIPFLRDNIALCYLQPSKPSSPTSTELKVAYRPGERFSVRDFHHAVNNISLDNLFPDVKICVPTAGSTEGFAEMTLADLLNNNALYKWGSDNLPKKVIVICSTISASTGSLRKSLMDAADRCIAVEFVVLVEGETNIYHDDAEKLMQFTNSVCDLESCVIRSYIMDTWLLNGLVKTWFQEIKNDAEEPLQAVFVLGNALANSADRICCNLFPSSTHISDGFISCQTCRCHGYPIDTVIDSKTNYFCPLNHQVLGASDLIDNVARIGEQTVLFLPSFEGCPVPQSVSTLLTFRVIERTNLASLNEGLMMGNSLYVTPSCHETESSDESDNADLNALIFHGLCRTLFLLDQGLVCTSTCNTETMLDGTFLCYYILQPSDGGPMLLRCVKSSCNPQRLASSEEALPIPNTTQASDVSIPEDLVNSIRTSLEKIELREYNPLQHERGFHAKLNWLVNESLQFGSISSHSIPNIVERNSLNEQQQRPLTQMSDGQMHAIQNTENNCTIADEWEKLLIVDDLDSCYSAPSSSKPKIKSSNPGSQDKFSDEKTSRILERLEAPKQQFFRVNFPSNTKNFNELIKKSLIPLQSGLSQPLKPNFQKLKRKQR
ncbi:uncharacterized protein LOC122045574 isoform X1 [Zingiber officinale]|uniref:uncharacterized protein LOC122045574 isoform X1 n=1 Tax=Zingiber officinale TaxID=94328 RepID=UPI001C4DBF96|nr:uncharacterized protein LOC122045574 isoform X1 [Zingiber officinale]XP_042461787.1 uncharacterized protein LOC122045574 isoform X1 [Zingiber officinale]